VTKGGAADRAGIQVGDVITKINGQLISDGTQLIVTVRSFAPGDRVQLTIKRGDETLTLPLNLTASKA
jgi:putative serine protease PepD